MIDQKELMDYQIKNKFINNEIMTLSILGAFGHNSIYNKKYKDFEKDDFKNYIRNILYDFGVIYIERIEENDHYNNLIRMQEKISLAFGHLLKNQQLNIGTVQKLLNLYLKYKWCLNLIPAPPHCPIDSIILKKINKEKIKWTKMSSVEEYKAIISEIKKLSKNMNIAEWELKIWNNR